MNIDIEIFNFLNLINPKLGSFYKKTGHNPLPDKFSPSKDNIKDVLILKQIKCDVTPNFASKNKREIKKQFKNFYKNSKKILKNKQFFQKFSPKFAKKVEIYINFCEIVSRTILKNFKNHDFDEIGSFNELMELDPVFAEVASKLFESDIDLDKLFENLELKYNLSYSEKIKLIEKKTKRNKKENQLKITKNLQKTVKKVEKTEKIEEKQKNKRDAKLVRTQIKSNKSNSKNKEK